MKKNMALDTVEERAERLWALIAHDQSYNSRCKILEILSRKTEELYAETNRQREEQCALPLDDPEDAPFLKVYEKLADQSRTDSPGGMEYRRVLLEWRKAERPKNVKKFILDNV